MVEWIKKHQRWSFVIAYWGLTFLIGTIGAMLGAWDAFDAGYLAGKIFFPILLILLLGGRRKKKETE